MARMNLIQISKVGSHTASSGQVVEFTEDDFLATINAYDPAIFEAPLVVGHPKTNNPAYGWVKALNFEDDILGAMLAQVDFEFAENGTTMANSKRSLLHFSPRMPKTIR
eukprot:UN01743